MERGTRRTSLTWYLSRSRCLVKDRGAHKRWQAGQVVDSSLRGEAGAGGERHRGPLTDWRPKCSSGWGSNTPTSGWGCSSPPGRGWESVRSHG